MTGTYTLDSAGAGTITLSLPDSSLAFSFSAAMAVDSANPPITSAGLLSSGPAGSGSLARLVSPDYGFTGPMAISLTGENAPAPGLVFGSGLLTCNYGNADVAIDLTAVGTPLVRNQLQGSCSSPDYVTGRYQMGLVDQTVPQQDEKPYVLYQVDPQHFFFMSLTPHATAPLLLGRGTGAGAE